MVETGIVTFLMKFGSGGAVLGAIVGAAASEPLGTSSQLSLIWGALLGSIGVTLIATLWKIWLRSRRIIEHVIDAGFDKLEVKVGLKPGNFDEEPDFKTPLDELLKKPEEKPKPKPDEKEEDKKQDAPDKTIDKGGPK